MAVSTYTKFKKPTTYKMISKEVAHRLCETFYDHSMFVNEKYKTFRIGEDWISSDRDRFVNKFFKPYVGRYFILINKDVVALKYGDSYMPIEQPYSIFSLNRGYKETTNFMSEGNYKRVSKKYLHINYFQAVNEPYGRGYMLMHCSDLLGDSFSIKLDASTLTSIQFIEITKKEFNDIVDLFVDNREEMTFKVTRFLTIEEMKERKLMRRRRKPVKETFTVKAKDSDGVCAQVPHALEIELVK
jgi:hypothetical protein